MLRMEMPPSLLCSPFFEPIETTFRDPWFTTPRCASNTSSRNSFFNNNNGGCLTKFAKNFDTLHSNINKNNKSEDALHRPRVGTSPFKAKLLSSQSRRCRHTSPYSPPPTSIQPFKVEQMPAMAIHRSNSLPESMFKAEFDLKSFNPSEIKVKLQDQSLVVEANHEANSPDGHFEQHTYIRKVPFPDNVPTDNIKCILDQLGRLQIEAMDDSDQPIQTNIVQSNTINKYLNKQPEVVIEDIGPE